MNKVRKQFILYAALAIFVLLAVLLSVINGINFTMAASDADQITAMLSSGNGMFTDNSGFPGNGTFTPGQGSEPPAFQGGENGGRFGKLGPASPELTATLRYFTCSFTKNGEGQVTAFKISAVSEDEALSWAESLLEKQESGWTRTVYRYRVYKNGSTTYVTVIDQGRELLPSYRILIISVVGGLLGVLISVLSLIFISRRLFKPLEEADRKQKRFIADVEKEFKVPLTVINANTEIMERENGESDYTVSINRQVKRMTGIIKELGSLAIFSDDELMPADINVSNILGEALDSFEEKLKEKSISLNAHIDPDVMINGDDAEIKRVFNELIENIVKFAVSNADISLKSDGGRIQLIASNDADISEISEAQEVFDRFTRLKNAENIPGNGLGLSYVKDVVKSRNGRLSAEIKDGRFTVIISL